MSKKEIDLMSTFGMHEMEKAAKTILKRQEGKTFGFFSPMYIDSFETEEEKTGFIELVYGGFMGKQSPREDCNVYTYNGGFVPNEKFFNRIQNRTGASRETAQTNVSLRVAGDDDIYTKDSDFS